MNRLMVLLIVILVFSGCAGTQQPAETSPTTVQQPTRQPETQPEEEPASPKPSEASDIEPEEVPEPPAVELQEQEEAPPPDGPPTEEPAEEPEAVEQVEEYIPTQETYDRTFTEVEATIDMLNKIISEQDYTAWRSYLTTKYLREMSSPEKLRELSDHRILRRNNIVLTSLEDYFRFVVVPSRANARLDDLVFRNDEQVEAIMVIQGQRVILYQLRKVDGTWKIDIF